MARQVLKTLAMMQSRRVGSFLWVVPVLASMASCSGGDADKDRALVAGGLGDGEIAGPPGASGDGSESRDAVAAPSASPRDAYDAPSEAPDTGSSAGADAPSAGAPSPGAPSPGPAGEASSDEAPSGGLPYVEPDDSVVVDPAPVPQIAPGTLTAGAWDDNRNLDRFLSYRDQLHQQNLSGLLDFSAPDHQAAHDALAQRGPHTTLDVSLVIDTTGSMGDELRYLQAEFVAISTAIETRYPDAEQHWSLVLYKDQGDSYVTRWFDFRSDALEFRDHLAQQSASGGGDFPEAPDVAFEIMNQLAWRTDPATARLAFWVADAPHHAENAAALKAGIEAAEAQDIHIYPVASSGIDELTELTMRSAAQLTGGRYLFLTNDSGVGNDHKEPSIPCYFVTKLDSAILRMVDVEMTGEYREPSAEELVRSSGDPQDGTCTLQSGQPAFAF